MVRRDGAEVRRERIQQVTKRVLSLLHKNNGEIPLSKTLALLQYEFGLRQETIMEYLRIAEATGRFFIDIENDKMQSNTES